MSVVLPILGAVLTAGSAIAGGIAQGHAASYQAHVASNNAVIAKQNAGYAESAGQAQTERAGLKARQQFGQVRAGIAANGLDVNSGSGADVQTGQREIGALDTTTTANNAALAQYGYETQATGFQAQSELDKAEAGSDPIAGAFKGAGDLLSNPSVDSGASSLMSGLPTLSDTFSWMRGDGSLTNPIDDGG